MNVFGYIKQLFVTPFKAHEVLLIIIGLVVMVGSIILLFSQMSAGSVNVGWYKLIPLIGSVPLVLAFVSKAIRLSRNMSGQ